jgi:uncharacterized protein
MNLDLIFSNLLSPPVLCFLIGAFAALVRSDLRVPSQMFEAIGMYLLFAIGLKGGLALATDPAGVEIIRPIAATLLLGLSTPIIAFTVARYLGRQTIIDAAAIAAHYGSVSAVTFIAALNFAQYMNLPYNGMMTALLVMLEIPGIVVALLLARLLSRDTNAHMGEIIREALTGKSIILLLGGMIVGLMASNSAIPNLETVFKAPFQGILTFFMLELGYVAFQRLREGTRSQILFMVLFGILMPPVLAILGLGAGILAGLTGASLAIFMTMAASASYIAAPAAVKMSLPSANPGLYLTMAISITLPFNIVVGIPAYFWLAQSFMA